MKSFRILPILLLITLLFTSSVAMADSDADYYTVLKPNYTTIALQTGTDANIWWTSEEALQATFGLLVSLDLDDSVENFHFYMSEDYPIMFFGAANQASSGGNGICFAFLSDRKKGLYFPAIIDLDVGNILVNKDTTIRLTQREAQLFLFSLCGENVKELSLDAIQQGAEFLQEQFALNK